MQDDEHIIGFFGEDVAVANHTLVMTGNQIKDRHIRVVLVRLDIPGDTVQTVNLTLWPEDAARLGQDLLSYALLAENAE